eukprot:6214025-Pleurochrysis_carterae.AAC.5
MQTRMGNELGDAYRKGPKSRSRSNSRAHTSCFTQGCKPYTCRLQLLHHYEHSRALKHVVMST